MELKPTIMEAPCREEGKEGEKSFTTSMEFRFWHLHSNTFSMEAWGHQLDETENCTFEKNAGGQQFIFTFCFTLKDFKDVASGKSCFEVQVQ